MSESLMNASPPAATRPRHRAGFGLAVASQGIRRALPYTLAQALPWPYGVTVVGVAALYYLGYAIVWLTQGQGLANTDILMPRAIGFPISMALAFFLTCYLERELETMLVAMRPVVLIADEAYAQFMKETLQVGWRTDGFLLLFGFVLGSLAWYTSTVTAVTATMRGYVLFGILLVSWLSSTWLGVVRRGVQAVIRIQNFPLTIDIFDSDDLRPVAKLSLHLSAPIAIVTLLMILSWGFDLSPIMPYLYAGFLVAGVLAFFLPLNNLHHQMVAAKARELEVVQTMVRVAYERLKTASEAQHQECAQTLANLLAAEARVIAAPTWPYDVTIVGQLAATLLIPLALTLLQIVSSRW